MNNSGGKLKSVLSGLILAVAVFIFGASSTQAVTNLAGYPSGAGGVMSLANSPYVVTADILIPTGQTLTIEPGVIVKMQSGRSIVLLNGNIVIGSEDNPNPVVITSYKDDAYGGDTNGDGPTSPERGDWKYIQVSSAASSLTANNVVIRYGGLISSMVQVLSGAHATIVNATIEYSNDAGLGIRNGDSVLTLTDSIIRNNYEGLTISFQADATVTGTTFSGNRRGLAIDTDADTANLSISNNTFSGNNVVAGDTPFAGLDFADTDDTLIAINNDWGSTSGPTIASNPSGAGDRIIGNVTYSPWTGQNQTPTLSYVGTSGYTTDGVEPNISFRTQNAPAFKVLYSDPESVPASYMRLIVSSTTYAMATGTGGAYEFSAATSTFAKASYNYHFEASDGTNTARLPATGELSFEVRNTPVLLVPGIMGTEMKKGDDLIWPNVAQMVWSSNDDFMDPLLMNLDGTPSDASVSASDVLRRPVVGYDYLAGLIEILELNNYQENVDLFVFPYDWRLNINTTSESLGQKINDVLSLTGSSKIDLISHSMGGLLAKKYLLRNGTAAVDKLLFIGTPNLGSPKAVKTLLFGDDLLKIDKSFLGINVSVSILNPEEVKKMAKNMASIYELMPSAAYISQLGKYFYDLTQQKSFAHQEVNDYLIGQGLNESHVQSSASFHSDDLDNFNTDGIDAYNVIGCNTATLGKVIIRNHELVETEYDLEFVAGDGTVPFGSANAVNAEPGKVFYAKSVEHATMPSQTGIKQLIGQIINEDIDISQLSNITQDINQCVFNGQVVSVHSPVNLHVYDATGNHVGPDANGDIELNIAGATYEQIGNNKFVFVPNAGSQSYSIDLDGTGAGTFSLRVSKIENNEVIETAYFNDIPVTQTSEANVILAGSVANTVLQIDQNGTGSFTTAPVSAVLDSTQAADITQPASTISVSGNNTAADRYQTSATVSLSATDDNAGVLKTEYSLDNGATWQTYASSLIITILGNTTIKYRSVDKAGNTESTKSKTIEIVAAPKAVIITPPAPSPIRAEPTPTPQVLGEQIERPANEQYTKEQILDALANANIDTLLDYLGKIRNTGLEIKVVQDYGKYLVLDKATTNFIAYGTKSTDKLGIGERAGVLRSYQYAFGKLPQTTDDWQDAVNISTGQSPSRRNAKVEQEARDIVKKIYGNVDEKSVIKIAYGLRPEIRDIKKERAELRRFGQIFGRMPSSVLDWNIFREIVYKK